MMCGNNKGRAECPPGRLLYLRWDSYCFQAGIIVIIVIVVTIVIIWIIGIIVIIAIVSIVIAIINVIFVATE